MQCKRLQLWYYSLQKKHHLICCLDDAKYIIIVRAREH